MNENIDNQIAKTLPNGVIFKLDDGRLVVVLLKDGKWDWDRCLMLDMNKIGNEYNDISPNPFQFVFVWWDDEKMTTGNVITTVPNYTFSKLYDEGILQNTIETDYVSQYGSSKLQ